MAKQLTNSFLYKGGYVDSVQSTNDLASLLAIPRSEKFVGLTTTVLNGITTSNGESIPVDVWLSESRNTWVVKNIPNVESIESLNAIPSAVTIPMGFKVSTKDGKSFIFNGLGEESVQKWESDITRDEFDETISDTVELAVQDAIDKVTSGATEAFDTLKEIEEWIKTNSGSSIDTSNLVSKEELSEELSKLEIPSIEGLASEESLQSEVARAIAAEGELNSKIAEVESKIPSLDGYATEEWVNNQGFIKEHQDISHLIASADVVTALEDVKTMIPNVDNFATKEEIPSLDGYATETYVKNAIAEAQLSGETEIDLSGYATKDDIKDLASKDDIKVYTTGTGVSIIDNKINVLIETGDTENRNYIKVNEDNSLSVEEIGLDDAVTTEAIQVNGGAWAAAIQDIYGDTIPVGTSFQDFLKAMSCKEYFVSDITTTSSFTVSLSSDLKPTFEGAKSGEIVEVGTKIILGAVEGLNTNARQTLSAQTFTYGYKLGENGAYNSGKVYTEALLPIISGETGVKNLKLSFTKFASAVQGGAISDKSASGSIGSTTIYAQEGQNLVRIYQTGDTYTSNTAVTAGTIYIATNLKNYYKSDKVTPNTYTLSVPAITKTATAQTTYTVTGANKYFIGDINVKDNGTYWNENRSTEVIALAEQGWATADTINVQYTFKEGTRQQTVVVPSIYQSVTGKDVNNGDVTFNEVKTFEFTNAQGYKSMYKAFVAPAPDGLGADSIITITIKK
jgi:hypothetical protein